MSRKKAKNGVHIVLVISIITLNIIGINYANWDGSMVIANSVVTGNIEPAFCDYYEIDTIKGEGDIRVRLSNDQTMSIQGEVEPGFKMLLDYSVINEGSIPAKMVEEDIPNDVDGLRIKVKHPSKLLEPQEYNQYTDDGGKLQISADDEGKYKFEIELLYRQWE